jgi:myo-inositol-1(or 4)-monophosphatase
VDPICGSLNFVQGIPYFGISIALRSEGQICLGVVYDPCREEMFEATSQSPVTLNGRKIFIQQISDGSDAWESAVVGTDWPCAGERRARTKLILGLMSDQVNGCQLMGSPSLGLCSVAAGRLHAYWHLDLKIWDIAAASLIVQRAGGILTDLEGSSWLYSDGGYVASNEVVHNRTIDCIRAVSSFAGEN